MPIGLRVARLKLVFTLPNTLHPVPLRLAYIEWFRPFGVRDHTTSMFVVAPATRNQVSFSQVVELEDIVRSCHLIPKFGSVVSLDWTRDNVYDRCNKFFVNPFIDVHSFILFQK